MASPTPASGFLGDPDRVPGAAWAKVALAAGLGAVAVAVVPRGWDADADAPPVGALVSTGAVVGLVSAAALFWALRRDFGFPARVALFAVSYQLCVVFAKFVLAPQGLYEVNQDTALTAFISLDESIGAAAAASLVLLLYAAAYGFVYVLAVRRPALGERVVRGVRRAITPGRLAVLAGLAVLVVAGLGGVLVLVLVPLLFVETGVEYLEFVFSSGVSLLVAISLAAATGLAAISFRAAAASPAVVADATLLASFFWLGLAFLALYHALWVVYLLVLTALWPLRVVVPK